MGSIQNKTLNDISKFPYVLRNFILNTPHKIFLEYGIPKLRNSDQVKHTLQSEKESKMILAHDKENLFVTLSLLSISNVIEIGLQQQ